VKGGGTKGNLSYFKTPTTGEYNYMAGYKMQFTVAKILRNRAIS